MQITLPPDPLICLECFGIPDDINERRCCCRSRAVLGLARVLPGVDVIKVGDLEHGHVVLHPSLDALAGRTVIMEPTD